MNAHFVCFQCNNDIILDRGRPLHDALQRVVVRAQSGDRQSGHSLQQNECLAAVTDHAGSVRHAGQLEVASRRACAHSGMSATSQSVSL